MPSFVAPLLAVLISLSLTAWLSRYRGRWVILDHPNPRSLHVQPRPRSGGLAMLAGLIAGSAWLLASGTGIAPSGWAIAAVLLVASISLVDDIRDTPAWVRLPVHFGAAVALALGAGIAIDRITLPFWDLVLPEWLGIGGSILYMVWMLNLYNFMDGVDGLAGGMAVWGFGACAVLGWLAGAPQFALLSLCIAAAAGGFLVFNFSPAKIFMGDAGAGTLGLLAAVFTLWGARDDIFPIWIGVLAFSPFVVDASWTLVRRLLTGELPWRAHRSHAYQRLVQSGWTHRRVALWEYLLMTFCAGSAILAAEDKNPVLGAAILFGWIAAYILLGLFVDRTQKHSGDIDREA